MRMFRRSIVMTVFFCLVSLDTAAMGRPTKEEKSQRRSAFWGLFADLYRASGCMALSPINLACAKKSISDGLRHAAVIDQAMPEGEARFQRKVNSIAEILDGSDGARANPEIRSLLKELMTEFAESSAPAVQPSKELGREVYEQYCSSCHGNGLGGPGKLSSKLRSQPGAFSGSDRLNTQFPFGIYSVIIHGTDDGEMASLLDVLTVDELWAVSFHVASLPYVKKQNVLDPSLPEKINAHADTFALSALAMATGDDLKHELMAKGFDCGECENELAYLRLEAPWQGSTLRLSKEAKAPRDNSEARAVVLLLVGIIVVSAGFIYILKRSGRVDS